MPISTPSPGFPHHPHDDLVKAIRRRRLSAAQIVGVAIVAYRRLMLGKQFPVSPQTAFCNCYLPHGLGFDIDESVLLAHPGIRTRPTDRTFYI